jgi:hypothetical protein
MTAPVTDFDGLDAAGGWVTDRRVRAIPRPRAPGRRVLVPHLVQRLDKGVLRWHPGVEENVR